MAQRNIYLAGPEVFLPNATAIGEAKIALCAEFGFRGLYPAAGTVPQELTPPQVAAFLYRKCIAMMQQADLFIANMTPFRGPSADLGTAFELGYLTALGKPAFAYCNDPASLVERTRSFDAAVHFDAARQVWVDGEGLLVEDFQHYDNLMVAVGLAAPVVLRDVPHAERYTDLGGLRACLELARGRA